MKRLLFLAALMFSSPALAASTALVNQTGEAISATSIRPTNHGSWQPVGGPLPAGGQQTITASTDLQCAFDIRVRLASGKDVVYSGVNLCETSAVRLNRRADGTIWVDYD